MVVGAQRRPEELGEAHTTGWRVEDDRPVGRLVLAHPCGPPSSSAFDPLTRAFWRSRKSWITASGIEGCDNECSSPSSGRARTAGARQLSEENHDADREFLRRGRTVIDSPCVYPNECPGDSCYDRGEVVRHR